MSEEAEENRSEASGEEKQKAPQKQRPKMTLGEQSVFLNSLLSRCTMHSGDHKGYFAGEAMITLTQDDMLALEVVQQTIAVFELYRADVMVRDAMQRKFRGAKR